MSVETGDKITRKYNGFRGVDFRGEECSLNRSPDSLNVWRNYKNLASIETRPALEHIYTFPEKSIKTMKWHKDKLYFLTNDGDIYALYKGALQSKVISVGEQAILFEFNGDLYAKGTERYCNVTKGKDIAHNEKEDDQKYIEPHIPTTTIGRPVSVDGTVGGTTHEDVNMLSDYRINTFRGLGAHDSDGNPINGTPVLYLDATDIDDDFGPILTVEWFREEESGSITTGKSVYDLKTDDWKTTFEVDYQNGTITGNFSADFSKPLTDGQDNITVLFKKTQKIKDDEGNYVYVNKAKEKIIKCTIAQEFDNRVFLSGNPDYPSTIWHCSLNDPSYFSDLDYYVDGADNAPIRSMVAGNNGLWVFRDATDNSVFYHQPAFDEDYGKIYPSSHSSIAMACVGKAVNFNDDIVFFSPRGMEGASTDVTTEQFATHRSSLVDRKMLAHKNTEYKGMILAEWEGYLLVFIGSDVYLADSRAVLSNENHIEYEWYHWNFGEIKVSCSVVHDGVLYIGTEQGRIYSLVCKVKDEEEEKAEYGDEFLAEKFTRFESYWTTPKDTFSAPNKLKTTNKKGCVVEALGDVTVSVKTDDDTKFELIGENKGINDYFVSRIKRKKWKDIQLKFESDTSFSLEAATLEAFIGGYIKR